MTRRLRTLLDESASEPDWVHSYQEWRQGLALHMGQLSSPEAADYEFERGQFTGVRARSRRSSGRVDVLP